MELIQQLTSALGVNEQQAEGGAGLLFGLAKDKLGSADFGKIAEAVPGVDDMIASAPTTGDGGGSIGSMLGGIASSLGAGDLGNLASLAGGFEKLGLDAGTIQKFLPIVIDFVGDKGGDTVKNLLAGAFK
ncbi:MAG: DUF2780 domain-containing protein [Bacteroidetes bacterium]|nr:DUF2780 domain-containing protein [Bacteroidota bacterium]